MASRSGEDGGANGDKPDPNRSDSSLEVHRPERPFDDERTEVILHIKVGYKTILLMVVIFDVVHLSIREIVDTNIIEQLFDNLS